MSEAPAWLVHQLLVRCSANNPKMPSIRSSRRGCMVHQENSEATSSPAVHRIPRQRESRPSMPKCCAKRGHSPILRKPMDSWEWLALPNRHKRVPLEWRNLWKRCCVLCLVTSAQLVNHPVACLSMSLEMRVVPPPNASGLCDRDRSNGVDASNLPPAKYVEPLRTHQNFNVWCCAMILADHSIAILANWPLWYRFVFLVVITLCCLLSLSLSPRAISLLQRWLPTQSVFL